MGSRFDIKPITYQYRPYFLPTHENKIFQLMQTSDDAKTRTVDVWYGVTIKFQFNGRLVKFSWPELLKTLTTGLVLLSMATTLVAVTASYILPLSHKYQVLMYQLSEDFTDYSTSRDALRSRKTWHQMETVKPVGAKLLEKLNADGESGQQELTNTELVRILCTQ